MLSFSVIAFSSYAARGLLGLLILLSVLSLAFFIERKLFFKRRFLRQYESVANAIEQADSLDAIIHVLRRRTSAETTIILKGIAAGPPSGAAFSENVNAYLYEQRKEWERYSLFFGSVGSNAPFIGLLGTVLGILKSFADLGLTADNSPHVVMAGISEALILTAAGLAVAIPTVLFFNICKQQVQRGIGRVQAMTALISSKNLLAVGDRNTN